MTINALDHPNVLSVEVAIAWNVPAVLHLYDALELLPELSKLVVELVHLPNQSILYLVLSRSMADVE